MSYEIQLTKEIKVIYDPWKGDRPIEDEIETTYFILGFEVIQKDLDAALRLKYSKRIWQDLRARQEIAALDRLLDDLAMEPSEWLTGGVK